MSRDLVPCVSKDQIVATNLLEHESNIFEKFRLGDIASPSEIIWSFFVGLVVERIGAPFLCLLRTVDSPCLWNMRSRCNSAVMQILNFIDTRKQHQEMKQKHCTPSIKHLHSTSLRITWELSKIFKNQSRIWWRVIENDFRIVLELFWDYLRNICELSRRGMQLSTQLWINNNQ